MVRLRKRSTRKIKTRQSKLEILKQSKERTPMPRPAVFRNKKKFDRKALKDAARKGEQDV